MSYLVGSDESRVGQGGVVVPSLDSQLAATAQRHQLTLVTHNTAHFEKTGVAVLNPFA